MCSKLSKPFAIQPILKVDEEEEVQEPVAIEKYPLSLQISAQNGSAQPGTSKGVHHSE